MHASQYAGDGGGLDLVLRVAERISTDLAAGKIVIPPFPRVAVELHKIAQSPMPDLQHACRLIKREVELAGRVVKSASSIMFGGRPVDSLESAAVRLGANGLRDVAMGAAMGTVLRATPLADLARDISRHCFVVGVVSHHLCGVIGVDRGQGFTCGLFHDLGRLAIVIALGQYARAEPQLLEPATVRAISDRLHARVGAAMLAKWGLGELVTASAAHHHDPAAATGGAAPFAYVVAIADVADRIEAADVASRADQLASHALIREAGLNLQHVAALAEVVEASHQDSVLNTFIG